MHFRTSKIYRLKVLFPLFQSFAFAFRSWKERSPFSSQNINSNKSVCGWLASHKKKNRAAVQLRSGTIHARQKKREIKHWGSTERNEAINNFDNDFIASQQPKSMFFYVFNLFHGVVAVGVVSARSTIICLPFLLSTHTQYDPLRHVMCCCKTFLLYVQFTNERVPTVFSARRWASTFWHDKFVGDKRTKIRPTARRRFRNANRPRPSWWSTVARCSWNVQSIVW